MLDTQYAVSFPETRNYIHRFLCCQANKITGRTDHEWFFFKPESRLCQTQSSWANRLQLPRVTHYWHSCLWQCCQIVWYITCCII